MSPPWLGTKDGRRRSLTELERRFVLAYLGPAYEIPSEAARLAGAATPAQQGAEMARRLTVVIDSERALRTRALQMGPSEVLERLSWTARNGDHVGWAVATKAAEIVARVRGLLSDRIDLSLNMDSLRGELREAVAAVRVLPDSTQTQDTSA